MLIQLLTMLFAVGSGGHEQSIDTFQYADTPAASQAWAAAEKTPAVEVVKEGGQPVVQFLAPFARNTALERTIHDRNVSLDLAAAGQFSLNLAVDEPAAVGHVSLYFRSGKGWYSAGEGLHRKGRQTLEFSKASFSPEGQPAGWHKIDGIRISIWRGQAKDSTVRLEGLSAWWHDVALVIPAAYAHPEESELHAALQSAETVSRMLAELGLGSDAVEDAALAQGALGSRRVAILAYNPHLGDEAVAALEKFVASGGKLFVCYSLPHRLAKALDIEPGKYVGQKQPGDFAEIRFDATDVAGLPKAVRQASWNITTAKPIGAGARVIGSWFDSEGKPTGLPAMLLSDHGAYLSHILLSDDRAGKKQLLASILGRLCPPLWEQMAKSELARMGQIGHCETVDALVQFVKESKKPQAIERLEAALAAKSAAEASFAAKSYPEVVQRAREARDQLAEAYLRSVASPTREGRAIWNHSGTGAYPGDWERSAKELSAAGFNMVVPNMLWGGLAHYASDVLPRSRDFEKYGDQIAQCVEAAKRHGLEVHVWKVNWNLSNAPKPFIEKLRAEKRLQVTAHGEPHDWLCPSHPDNFKLELESMLEVARKYDVDGLHFDYIRYPDGQYCYCDGCRERFQKDTGVKVAQWPADCYSGSLKQSYRDWRCQQITRLVAAVHDQAKKLKPKLKISAAVFGSYPDCRQSVGQDWVAWVKAGYLDFICPMDYTTGDLEFKNLVSHQLKLVEGRTPLYAGIGAWRLGTPDRVVSQILLTRSLGAQGFTIFNFDPSAAGEIIPGIGLGAGSQPAVPPHRK
jgi:uncharacterized lipoprotein YddW (UPF0748 family)